MNVLSSSTTLPTATNYPSTRCGTFVDARGIDEAQLVEGASRPSMEQLAHWTFEAERVITF